MTRSWNRTSALAAALVAVPGVAWTCVATLHASYEPFGRDQGIFQYVGWALSRGERDYVDVHDINGPLVPLIHVLLLKVGGADERVFRCLDLALFGAAALLFGALLPGVGDRAQQEPARPRVSTRVAWALASWVVLSAGYLLFDWWSHAQRESFFDDLLVPSIGLQLWAQRPAAPAGRRRILLALAGGLGAVTWFGKPTCVLYSATQALALVVDDERPDGAGADVRAFAVGCAVACVPMFALLCLYGDPLACARAMFLDVWRLHRYIWHKSVLESYRAWNNAPNINTTLVTLLLGAVAVATGALPRRLLAVFALIVGGLATFLLQGKGFPYHLQSAVVGVHLLWLSAAAVFVERVARARARGGRDGRVGPAPAVTVTLGLLALAYQTLTETRLSPPMTADWYADRRAAGPDSEIFLRHFTGGDYFAWDLHQAAAYVRAHTRPDERVQTYGMDPYVLFLAERLSATPYIYNFELDVDSALDGGPGRADRDWMMASAARSQHDLFERVRGQPPGAFVTTDLVPYTFPPDADADFASHCPEAFAWVREHYRLAERFGTVRVWLPSARR
jgi:hypothetical protein